MENKDIIPEIPFNPSETRKVQENPNLKAYVDWATANGVIFDKVQFPAIFGQGLMGSAAKEDIQNNEVFVYVPNKVLLTVERARSSEIGYIFDNHDSIFKANLDRDFLTLLMFVMYENQKGKDSFWFPYFDAVDPGSLTCYWDDKYIQALDDPELIESVKTMKETFEADWLMLSKLLKIYSPQHFDLSRCTYDLYKHCSAFISTRCFGWGLPSTVLAPIADSFNHHAKASTQVDFVCKRLHLQENKIYAFNFNFDAEDDNECYDLESSKLKYNVKRLFKEDVISADQQKMIEGEKIEVESIPNRYKEGEVFERFKNLMRSEVDNEDEFESEETKKERFPDHGLELWGIGYITSDHSEDEDEGDTEEQEDCAYNEDLRRKILSYGQSSDTVDFETEEFESISNNTRLREIYQFRWWSDADKDTYFVMMNRSGQPIKAGQQVYYNYGRRNNSYLFQNYGFVLDESNQYNTMHFRVTLATNPKQAINHVSELLPDQKTLEDRDNVDTTTEKVKLSPYRVSESLMNYLRSVLQQNYTGADQEYLMISSPRLIEYELMILDFAIDLLEYYGKEVLNKRSTVDEDMDRVKAVVDFKMITVLNYNIERKKIHSRHLKLLKVLRALLERIATQKQTFSRACFTRVVGVEDFDSDYEVFRRRMGLRHYFKELRMNMTRIAKAKDARAGVRNEAKAEKKKAKKGKKDASDDTKSTVTQSSELGGNSPGEKEKKPKAMKKGDGKVVMAKSAIKKKGGAKK